MNGLELHPFARLPARLKEATGREPPTRRRLREMAIDTRIPVVVIDNRYHFRESDVPEIARAVGLVPAINEAPL
jgi:hypothetical protein